MSPASRVLRAPKTLHLLRRRGTSLAAVAVTTAGLLVGVTFAAPAAFATTANPTPSAGARPGATRLPFSISGTTSMSVDAATGNALITDQLLTLPGRGHDVPISLSYNSSVAGSSVPSAVTGSNGSGWAITGFDERMVTNSDSSVTFYGPGGLSGVFTPISGGGFTSPSQFKATLSGPSSAYTLTYHSSQEKLSFNSAGRLTTDTDRNGNTTTFGYDPYNNPSSIVTSRGPVQGRTVSITTANNRITQLTQSTPNLSRSVQLTYTAGGNLRSVIDPDGNYTTFYGPGGADSSQVATIEFNVYTRLGYTGSKVSSVAQDNPAADGGAGTSTTRLSYASATQTLLADPNTDQSQAVSSVPHTTYTINAANLVSSAKDADGNSRSATYTPLGDTASTTNAAGGATTFSYPSGTNSGESLTGIANPGGATESATYSNTGANAYLPSSSTGDGGSKLSYTYDTNGNQTSSAQGASGPQAKVTYNTDGTPATSASPGAASGVTTNYAHATGDGNLTSITPPSGSSSLGTRSYTWDDFGRLHTATDGAGHTITYSYEPMDRITSVAYSDATTTVSYTYDNSGHVTQRTDASGTTTYTYDDLGHLLTVKNTANNNLITYTYDLAGQLATTTDALGTTTYSYDNAHQLQYLTYPQVGNPAGNQLTTRFANNSDGKRTDVWMQTNSDHSVWAAHEHYTYDTSGRITKVLGENGPATGPSTVENETLCYTAGSTPGATCPSATGTGATSTDRSNVQWTSETVSGENNAYTYDDHNRLTKDVVTGGSNPRTYTYGYDVAGNRTSSSVTGSSASSQTLAYNNGNQISSTGYTYDGAGNLTTSPTRSATFNAAGQQKTATVAGATSSYTYAGSNENELLSETVPNDRTYTLTYGRADKNGLPVIDSVNVSGVLPRLSSCTSSRL